MYATVTYSVRPRGPQSSRGCPRNQGLDGLAEGTGRAPDERFLGVDARRAKAVEVRIGHCGDDPFWCSLLEETVLKEIDSLQPEAEMVEVGGRQGPDGRVKKKTISVANHIFESKSQRLRLGLNVPEVKVAGLEKVHSTIVRDECKTDKGKEAHTLEFWVG